MIGRLDVLKPFIGRWPDDFAHRTFGRGGWYVLTPNLVAGYYPADNWHDALDVVRDWYAGRLG